MVKSGIIEVAMFLKDPVPAERCKSDGGAYQEELKSGWSVKGIYNEACASEGHCPYHFGRDKEEGARYFMVFRITEGTANRVDLSGTTVVYLGDRPIQPLQRYLKRCGRGNLHKRYRYTRVWEVLGDLAVAFLGGGPDDAEGAGRGSTSR